MLQLTIGITLVIAAVVLISVFSGKVTNKEKTAGSFVVAGAIMGTLVGGSSTIGTAQLAYQYGMSAWWFTLGGGVACLVLALVYAKPFYRSGQSTITGFVTKEYGEKSGVLAAIFSAVGSFINIISQLIAATAIIEVLFPNVSLAVSLIFSAIIMMLYIIFGGVKGSGVVGVLKIVLLYASMLITGILVLKLSGGVAGFIENVERIDNPDNINFYSLFSRGIGKDLGACLSLVLGVITTQSYAQVIFIAKSEKAAIKGSLLGALLIPPIGIGGILVGLYMRATHPGILSKTALTSFVMEYMNPLVGGIVFGALFIAVVGTGAGLALGSANILKRDILPLAVRNLPENIASKVTEKKIVVLILLFACGLSVGPLGDTILNFAFMSMGLRGATLFIPLCFALWLPGKISNKNALLAIVMGPVVVLLFEMWNVLPFDSLFAGVLVSLLIMLLGLMKGKLFI